MSLSPTYLLAASLLILSTLYYLLSHLRLSQTRRAISKNCAPVPVWRSWDLLGFSMTMTMTRAMTSNRMSEQLLSITQFISQREKRDVSTFQVYFPPGMRHFFTSDPRNLQAVLATQFKDFQIPEARLAGFKTLLGQGIFASNGERWAHSRALMRPQFNRDQIADLDLFEKHIQNLFQILDAQIPSPQNSSPKNEKSGWTQNSDIQHLIELFTIDTATEFLFGESVNSLSGKSTQDSLATAEEMKIFVSSFVEAERVTAESLLYNDLYWVLHTRKFKEQCAAVHKFVDTYVQRRLASPTPPKKIGGKERFVVLDALVADTKDPLALRYELLNILLAGADTIKASITFLLGSLAQHPDIFNKLRSEIIASFGEEEEGREITREGLKSCTYLQWCINETLRLYPPVPSNYREAVRDTTLPFGGGEDGNSPVFIKKGRFVNWSLYTIQTHPTIYGPDGQSFNPSRWSTLRPGFSYLPFNAGPRICIGQQFALTETAYVVVRLLQRYDGIDGSQVPEGRLPCEWKLVDRVAGGLRVGFHQRGS